MQREIDQILKRWKDSKIRKPLLVRGARQVGKSFSTEGFGKANFDNLVVVNFEESPEFIDCFMDYQPKAIIDRISILTNTTIKPQKSLLFLDEMQECPKAISALRYFYEKMPELHVIGAGSLIEFVLKSEGFRMPVGRIQSVFMYPMFFAEFLWALNEMRLLEYIETIGVETKIEPIFSQKLEHLFRLYLLIGGMPEAVSAYLNQVSMNEIQQLQSGLIRSYHDDFSKYASTAKHKYLKEVFRNAPRVSCQRYKYSNVNPAIESRFLKDALELLCDAKCLSKISHASGAGVPLASSENPRKFKISYLDIGLMQSSLDTRKATIQNRPILQINSGQIAEQFVAQELQSFADPYSGSSLHFWARDAKSSSAEVDFLIEIDGTPIPVEVKAGSTGSLKSMRLFLKEYPKTPLGIRYSMHELTYNDNILSIPLYMLGQTKRLLRSCV